ncbi:Retrovirus-related Pol polyprotein from transposon TNT 1-94 [Symbiodinium microadriaticum]|uniref:Retrovirus-related Pol polyprotein from transposon TNT 1-94 n=1 Tax=Symbiodinium microadriaticum TaxID=2951 RepID=A0A1Q9EL10_SYMMI|nr:Retrovirus-related Pol polyprotein from transposon TNT 1-94 [Symbiodinium microadriaticum]
MLATRAGSIVHRPPLLPDIDRVDDELTVLPLSLTEDGNPPKEWLLEHGRTRRCLACERGMFHGVKHSVTCRKRYRAWLQEQREDQPEAPGRQGGEESTEVVPVPIGIEDEDPVVDVELPDDFVDVEVRDSWLPSVEDYLPSESEGAPGPAPEAQSAEDEGYGVGGVPVGDAPMEVDSCWSVASYEPLETLEAVPLELAENFAVGVECRQSVFSSIEDDGWTELKMRDRLVYLQKPSFVRDDATDKSLDPAKANAGMAKEIRALDSLRVGDAITKQEADAYCREHGIRILSTRWVSVAKKDGETKEDIVRARIVARDYASGSPTAAELGISSPTSSNEAFRSFLVFVSATESEIVLADVSTAFLFALIVSPECVMLPPNIRFSDSTRVFLKLRKALYGLRSASLAWYKHLSELVKEMGLHASDTEKSVFSGEYEFKGKKVWMLLLAYVDDLMIACKDKEAALNLVERLGCSVKIKVTGILSRDKKIDFLGRVIQKIEYGLLLGLPEGYFSFVEVPVGSWEDQLGRSLSGCVILVDGFPIKAFTRQQSSVAMTMSSAEAELVAITEGAKEGVGVVSLIQHIWGAFRTCQEPPAIFSDSQAAINIGSMHGLLRRVRHIDLRVCWTQAAIQDRLSWVRGVDNPADLFTKALAKPHVHYEKLGITEHLPREALLITDAHCDQIVLSTLLGRIVSTSALERYARQLDEVNPVRNRWVVVEFCTSVNSGMKLAAEAFRDLRVICITEEENGLCEEIIALTRNFVVSMVEKGHDARLRKLWGIQRKLWKNLCLLVSPVEGVVEELQPYFAVEWPKTCQYWSWKDVQKMLESRERPVLTSLVDGCAVGMVGTDGLLIHKRWRVDSDYPPLASTLDSFRCTKDHIHSSNFDLRETQHYPVSMCEKVLSSLK